MRTVREVILAAGADEPTPVVRIATAELGNRERSSLAIARRKLRGLLAPRMIGVASDPVRVSAVGAQDLRLALDVLDYDVLDLELRILRLEGTMSPDVTIEIQTGMQTQSAIGWVTLDTFNRASARDTSELRHFGNPLRYIRWNVTAITGTNPAATFQIRGIGRRWG